MEQETHHPDDVLSLSPLHGAEALAVLQSLIQSSTDRRDWPSVERHYEMLGRLFLRNPRLMAAAA